MKKTIKTAMTAAMFAASLGATAGNAQYASAISQSTLESALSFDETVTTPTYQTVYGPPEVMESLFGTTTTDQDPVQLEGEPTIYTDDEIELGGVAPMYTDEYGNYIEDPYETTIFITEPMPLYGPPAMPGDFNNDRSVDARDLTLAKRKLIEFLEKEQPTLTYFEHEQLDFNQDNTINKDDIKALERYLTGKPEDEDEENDETRYDGTTTTTTTTTVPDWDETDLPQPVYGPPEWFLNDHDKYEN